VKQSTAIKVFAAIPGANARRRTLPYNMTESAKYGGYGIWRVSHR